MNQGETNSCEQNDYVPNERTKHIIVLLQEMLAACKKDKKEIIVGGGMALAIQAAQRGIAAPYRDIDDLDVNHFQADQEFWKKWFAERGFRISGNSEIKNEGVAFVAHSPDSKWNYDHVTLSAFYVDMYGIEIDPEGMICSNWSGEHVNYRGTLDQATTVCDWLGHKVRAIKYKVILRSKWDHGKTLRPKDIIDHQKFNVDPGSGLEM